MSKLRKTSDGNMPVRASLLAEKVEGASTISVSGLAGWAQGQRQDFIICKYDSDKKIVPGSVTSWTGVPASNGTIGALQLTGGQDQQYPIGAVVVASPTSAWANDLIDALLVHHDTNGNLKSGAVPFTALDLGTEYQAQAALVDFNDAKFLKPSKWVLTSKDNVTRSTNRPCDDAGWLTVQLLDATKIPGSHQGGFILQQYVDTDGRVYSRTVNSKNSSEAVYGKWQKLAGAPEKHKKDAHGWIKRELDGGAIEYSMNSGTHNIAITAANAFARDIKIPLPQGLKYDGEKMTANISVSANDPALRIEASVANGDGNITMCRSNSYNMTIHNTKLIINAILRVYPE